MKFSWINDTENTQKIRSFLKDKGVSHRMFSKIKHDGGSILLEGKNVFTSDYIAPKQVIQITMPDEIGNDLVTPDFTDLDIVYEDEHWLLVNKPAGIATVPGAADRLHTLVNRVKGYLIELETADQVPHVVTRLDRDTSGLVLLAKHKFAHSIMDDQLQHHTVIKKYMVFVNGDLKSKLGKHGIINQPIGRIDNDIIRREVREDGKESRTEFWVQDYDAEHDISFLIAQLHTGRTHQIRVHFSYVGFPLVGDDLYGGESKLDITHQALQAFKMSWWDPFLQMQQDHQVGLDPEMVKLKDIFNIDKAVEE